VGILSIQEGQFNIEPIPLRTVRPFKIGDIILEEEADNEENGIDMQKRETITAFLKIKVSLRLGRVESKSWDHLERSRFAD
jgi:double-strand break repair protein MRE11